ncbi:unnamed protein product [Mytilus coruscus]|uniref:Sacsin/Nov domain-containing protein n=1 Tax=Mytilus coruscus TaxID=42192 RepID=A0A6J8ANM7_MYTCO|nr:unnamed protein product [Mytilus coruscus]
MAFSLEQCRNARIHLVLRDVLSKILHELLENSGVEPRIVYDRIVKNRSFKLKQEEWTVVKTLVDPAIGFRQLDISLSWKIGKCFGLFLAPSRDWQAKPQPTEKAIGDDIQRIKYARNKYVHGVSMISEEEMQDFFIEFTEVGKRVDRYLKKNPDSSFESQIQDYQTLKMENRTDEILDSTSFVEDRKGWIVFPVEGHNKTVNVYRQKGLTEYLEKQKSNDEFVDEIRRFIERIFRPDEFQSLETMCMIVTSPEDEICADESSWVSEDDEDCLEEIESDTASLVLNFNIRREALNTDENFQESIQQFINTIITTSNGKQLTPNNEVTAIITPDETCADESSWVGENDEDCLEETESDTTSSILNFDTTSEALYTDEDFQEGIQQFINTTITTSNGKQLTPNNEVTAIIATGPSESADQCSNSLQNSVETNRSLENEEPESLYVRSKNMQQTAQEDIKMKQNDDEDSSDESVDDGPIYSSMKQPPLIKQLKKILDEYPDDGQILKEIIQNAEDAEASEMKVLFDGRSVNNDDSVDGKPFTKYFKGPALCVYNNAQFTKEDWEGIQMINSSVKEFDAVKIGRFGLGFKSVFHITDYPMIISKNKMLILDPHQTTPDRVCILMKLKKLKGYTTEMNISDCLSALEGIFGFSKNTLQSGKFTGTFFRFPLRSKPTLLSDNVYDKAKIDDLFRAFQSEASVELLFLKCLERIELYTKNVSELPSGEDLLIYTVNISESCIQDARKKRKQLHEFMKSVGNSLAEKSFMASYNMKIEMTEQNGEHTENEWYVMHCYKGGEMSKELKTLSQDESLSYSPYVSLGLPLFHDPEFKGHVFCLMPLPLQNESLTGFPVHVNGYFALTQNRRHVKWPTADQTKNKAHMDKTIRWNKCLVIEVLAEAYHMLINDTIQMSKSKKKISDIFQNTYTCIPDHRRITNDWAIILNPLYSRLLQTAFLYTENNGGKWIKSEDAVFNIFNEDTPEAVKETIVRLVQRYNVNLVNVPEHVTSMIRYRDYSVQKLTPKFILNFLKSDAKYKKITSNEKLDILHFILSTRKSLSLVGVELLPLQNGSFTLFGNRGRDKRIIGLQTELYRLLVKMAENNDYQLCTMKDLSTDDIATLLLGTIRKFNGKTTDHALLWKTSTNTVAGKKWLTNVWKFLQDYDIDDFCNLHLLPSCSRGSKDFLFKLSTKVLLKSYHGYTDLPDAVCKALSYINIVTVDTLPKAIINHEDINKIVYFPTVENVFNMLEDVTLQRNTGQAIQKFNKTCTEKERTEFAKYIATSSYFSSNVAKFISKLQIFKEKNSGRNVSSNEVNIIAETEQLPIKYQKESLVYSGHFRKALLNLQVPTIGMEDVVIDASQETFKFVPNGRGEMKRAIELFDPEDPDLKWIIIDQDRFPNMTKCPITLKQVRKLGLKTGSEVNANDILECAKYIESKPHEDAQDQRSSRLFDFLQKNSQLLRSITGQTNLSEKLMNVHFIKPSCRMENFPDMLPWLKSSFPFCKPAELFDHQYVLLIGSVLPVLQKNVTPELSRIFSWNKTPSIKSVIEQLFIIIRVYKDKYKPYLLPLINQIYNFLSVNYSRGSEVTPLKTEKWIWSGFGFEPSCNIVIETKTPTSHYNRIYFLCLQNLRYQS